MKKIIIIILIMQSILCLSNTIDYRLHRIDKFDLSAGISTNNIWDIKQDKYGFIWIATTEGINMFNGKEFIKYQKGTGKMCLSNNNSQDLLMTSDNSVWIATSQGLNIYNYQADSIQIIRKNSENNLSSNDIMCFSPNSRGIWIATYDKGVNFYNFDTKKFEQLKLPPNVPCKYITSLLHDKYNNLWIGTLSDNLICYSLQNKSVRIFNMPRVEDIYQDSIGNVWIAAANLYNYNSKASKLNIVNILGINPNNRARRLTQDNNGFLWVGFSECLGYFLLKDYYKGQNRIQLTEVKQTGDDWGTSFSQITSILADADNNIWIGTYGDGVYFLHGQKNKFIHISNNLKDPYSISGNNIKSISIAKNGRLYVGIAGKGIDELNNKFFKTRTITKQNLGKSGISSNLINCVYPDSKGNIWIGSNGLDKMSGNATAVTRFEYSFLTNTHAVCEDKYGAVWIGSENGLTRFFNNKFDDSFNKLVKQRIDVRALLIHNDIIWIGTYGNGLLSYNPINGKIINFENTDLTQNFISSIRAKGDNLYIATLGGGIRQFSFSKKKYINDYNQSNGLRSDFVQAIEIDSKDRLWMASNVGISCIENGKIRHFDEKDGIIRNEFSTSIRFLDENKTEHIAFGGNKGIFHFNPNDLPVYRKEYKVFFSSLKIFNQKVYPNDDINGGNPLTSNIINTNKIALSYKQSYFSLGVICTNFNHINNIIYSYKLKGIDNEWNRIGQDQEISFRNLKAGKYTLLAKASSSDDIWNSNIAELEIVVKPPFWLTGWAYLLYILIIGIILYYLWLASTIKLRAQHQINLEKSERQKEEEIYQAKLRFFTNISHELRTPLTLIIGPVKNLFKSHPEITDQLTLIDKNAKKLLSLVNQLLDFRKTETGNMKLNVTYNNLSQQINNIISSFDSMKQEKKMIVSLQNSVINLFGWYDADFIDKIMFNLLSNAYKFTPENGHISVEIRNIEKENIAWASISVKDTGIGIKTQDLSLIFDRFYQSKSEYPNQMGTGIGLHLVKNLIDIHSGNISVNSFVGKGSVFTFEIPLDKSKYTNSTDVNEDKTDLIEDEGFELGFEETQIENHDISKSTKTTILVVDDEEDICKLIKQTLPEDYRVFIALNGEDALSILKKEDCDLVISDIMMPVMDGVTLCTNIKTNIETSHIPVILLTAKSAIEDKIEGLKSGADSYISKPFHPEHLLVRIEKLIESRKMFKSKFSKNISIDLDHIENPSFDDIFLKKLFNYINQNIQEADMTGDQISSALNMSRMTLHRKVKQLTGQSIMELIKSVRLKEAAYQLENTNKNISDVCYEVGFNSPSYFTICFQSQYGITPTDYQKKNRKV